MLAYVVHARGLKSRKPLGPYVARAPLGALLAAGRELAAAGHHEAFELRATLVGPARKGPTKRRQAATTDRPTRATLRRRKSGAGSAPQPVIENALAGC